MIRWLIIFINLLAFIKKLLICDTGCRNNRSAWRWWFWRFSRRNTGIGLNTTGTCFVSWTIPQRTNWPWRLGKLLVCGTHYAFRFLLVCCLTDSCLWIKIELWLNFKTYSTGPVVQSILAGLGVGFVLKILELAAKTVKLLLPSRFKFTAE